MSTIMKRLLFLLAAVCIAASVSGCTSAEPQSETTAAVTTTAAKETTTSAATSETTAATTETTQAATTEWTTPASPYELPAEIRTLLEGLFAEFGNGLHLLKDTDLAPYFVGGESNESCTYYSAEINYYRSFRRLQPESAVKGYREYVYAEGQNAATGEYTVRHVVSFSYINDSDDAVSGISRQFYLTVAQEDGAYKVAEMHTNEAFENEYRHNLPGLAALTEETVASILAQTTTK